MIRSMIEDYKRRKALEEYMAWSSSRPESLFRNELGDAAYAALVGATQDIRSAGQQRRLLDEMAREEMRRAAAQEQLAYEELASRRDLELRQLAQRRYEADLAAAQRAAEAQQRAMLEYAALEQSARSDASRQQLALLEMSLRSSEEEARRQMAKREGEAERQLRRELADRQLQAEYDRLSQQGYLAVLGTQTDAARLLEQQRQFDISSAQQREMFRQQQERQAYEFMAGRIPSERDRFEAEQRERLLRMQIEADRERFARQVEANYDMQMMQLMYPDMQKLSQQKTALSAVEEMRQRGELTDTEASHLRTKILSDIDIQARQAALAQTKQQIASQKAEMAVAELRAQLLNRQMEEMSKGIPARIHKLGPNSMVVANPDGSLSFHNTENESVAAAKLYMDWLKTRYEYALKSSVNAAGLLDSRKLEDQVQRIQAESPAMLNLFRGILNNDPNVGAVMPQAGGQTDIADKGKALAGSLNELAKSASDERAKVGLSALASSLSTPVSSMTRDEMIDLYIKIDNMMKSEWFRNLEMNREKSFIIKYYERLGKGIRR